MMRHAVRRRVLQRNEGLAKHPAVIPLRATGVQSASGQIVTLTAKEVDEERVVVVEEHLSAPRQIDPRAMEVHQKLRDQSRRLDAGFWELVELATEVVVKKYYKAFGFPRPAPYLAERTGRAYRTVSKHVLVSTALAKLPTAEQAAATRAVRRIGVTRATIVAPLLKRLGTINATSAGAVVRPARSSLPREA